MSRREFEDLMDFGVGIDSLTGDIKGDCVLPRVPVGSNTGAGQDVAFFLEQIHDSSQLSESLEVSASGSMKAGFFGGGSAKAKFVSQQKTNSYSIYLLVRVFVKNPTQRLRDVQLTQAAHDLLASRPDSFRDTCGDEFLVGVTSGGEFFGIIEIRTTSEEEKRDISTSIRAKGSTWNVAADFASSIASIAQRSETKVVIFQKGGSETRIPVTVDEIISRAVNFPASVQGTSAFAYSASFQSYKTLLNLPPSPNFIDIQFQQDVIERLAALRLRYMDILGDIEYVLANGNQFETFDHTELSSKANQVSDALNSIKISASDCFNDFNKCQLPTSLIDPSISLPARLPQTVQTALASAVSSAAEAVKQADIAKKSAQKVLEIRGTITPGTSGKDQATLAKQESKNAETAATAARVAADQAIVARNTTTLAEEVAHRAELSADEASQAAEVAKRNSDQVQEIGLAPFWVGPTDVFSDLPPSLPGWKASWLGFALRFAENGVPAGPFSDFVSDPSGGNVIVSCAGNLHNGVCSQDNYSFSKSVTDLRPTLASVQEFYRFEIPNLDAANSKIIKVTLKSEKSGFSSFVELTVFDEVPSNIKVFISSTKPGGVARR